MTQPSTVRATGACRSRRSSPRPPTAPPTARPCTSWATSDPLRRALGPDPRLRGRPARPRASGRGDRVAMIVPNVPDFARVYYARARARRRRRAGAPAVQGRGDRFVLRDSGADLARGRGAAARRGRPRGRARPASRCSPCWSRTAMATCRSPRLEDEAAAADAIDLSRVGAPDQPPPRSSTRAARRARPRAPSARTWRSSSRSTAPSSTLFDMRRDDVVFGGLPLFHTFGQTAVMNIGVPARGRRDPAAQVRPRPGARADGAARRDGVHGGADDVRRA